MGDARRSQRAKPAAAQAAIYRYSAPSAENWPIPNRTASALRAKSRSAAAVRSRPRLSGDSRSYHRPSAAPSAAKRTSWRS